MYILTKKHSKGLTFLPTGVTFICFIIKSSSILSLVHCPLTFGKCLHILIYAGIFRRLKIFWSGCHFVYCICIPKNWIIYFFVRIVRTHLKWIENIYKEASSENSPGWFYKKTIKSFFCFPTTDLRFIYTLFWYVCIPLTLQNSFNAIWYASSRYSVTISLGHNYKEGSCNYKFLCPHHFFHKPQTPQFCFCQADFYVLFSLVSIMILNFIM